MASKIVLFYRPLSPPSRAVLLTAKAIGINLQLKDLNVLKGEHLTTEFRKVHFILGLLCGQYFMVHNFSDESTTYNSND